jgi:uncharacterized protein (DUF305 family)
MKAILTKALPLALVLLTATFILTACTPAGGGHGANESGDGVKKETAEESSGGMAGMDHDQTGHGSMGMGSGGMAKRMVTKNGEYSDEALIDAMVPHHQGAIAMARVAFKSAEHEEIKELSRNIVSTQQS